MLQAISGFFIGLKEKLRALRPNMGVHAVLLVILIVGLGFRVWGLSWGLPERPDIHPDEHDHVLKYALAVSWKHPDPGFLNYPSFLCYSTALLHGALKWVNPALPGRAKTPARTGPLGNEPLARLPVA